jgi:monothiol glutaredoxin
LFLFIKGTPEFPQCGFSANSIGILNALGKSFKTFDILSDMDIRQGVKEFSSWPTFPQLYFKGKLVGGNDIITELFETGELEKNLA